VVVATSNATPRTRRSDRDQDDGRRRIVIEGVTPEVDNGRFPSKRVVGDEVLVEVDVFADGHDVLSGVLCHRREGDARWTEIPLEELVNDRWQASFTVNEMGRYSYTFEAWVDHFKTWRRDLEIKVDAEQDVSVDLLNGARLIEEAAERAPARDAERLRSLAQAIRPSGKRSPAAQIKKALDEKLTALVERYPDRRFATRYERELTVVVDRERARFGAWYELFPRSTSDDPTRAGTFRDVQDRLAYVEELGFDVVYLPPIHPIGATFRKGKNNVVESRQSDPGSPWAIGSDAGGHKHIHPELGTVEDFDRLVAAAESRGIEIALDIAFQASPDHPWVREHPEWFRQRADGTIQYAENPPKKYQDIYPINFESPQWRELWEELKSVFEFWIGHGVHIFRVDNPHTKPFAFWEWVIGELKREHPELIFLSEAFTRPKIMYRLAKLGFTQSYTYFAWRNTSEELVEYFEELTQSPVKEFFGPNIWPNTPDILTESLQTGGRPAFVARFILAATLGASYGIYGPAYELGEHVPRTEGAEEYLNSEKYEIKYWDLDDPDSIREVIATVNRIRRENPALQRNDTLQFHEVDNEELLAYSKQSLDGSNLILTVVNLDPHHRQSGWVTLPLEELGIAEDQPYEVVDLLAEIPYRWEGATNYVELDTHAVAHVFLVHRPLTVVS